MAVKTKPRYRGIIIEVKYNPINPEPLLTAEERLQQVNNNLKRFKQEFKQESDCYFENVKHPTPKPKPWWKFWK